MQAETTPVVVDLSDYTDEQELYDTLGQVAQLLTYLLTRKNPKWLDNELRLAIERINGQLDIEEEWLQ